MDRDDEKSVYYVDTEGQYWDEISNKKLDKEGVIAARLDEIQQVRRVSSPASATRLAVLQAAAQPLTS